MTEYEWTGRFYYRWSVVPVRFWRYRWHWRFSLTRFESNAGEKLGTWLLFFGPLKVSRYAEVRDLNHLTYKWPL